MEGSGRAAACINLLGRVEAAATVFSAFGTERPADSCIAPVAGVRRLLFSAVPGVRPPVLTCNLTLPSAFMQTDEFLHQPVVVLLCSS